MRPAAPEVTLEAKLAFLRQPSSFPEQAYRVEAIETHMSWVFLTDGYAYKLKKPVRNALLDFGSLAARQHYCEEELRLNRRLAPQVYLGLAALGIDAHGHLGLDVDGSVIDWLVKMRRLPTHCMLDYALKQSTATQADMQRVAQKLAGFYRNSTPAALDAAAYRSDLLHDIENYRRQLSQADYQLPAEWVQQVCHALSAYVQSHSTVFDQRIASGKIVEGHGDLRPEHVCLQDELPIIDCLEFSQRLRTVDAIDEVAFLTLECTRRHAADMGQYLLDVYRNLADDHPPLSLIHFYQGLRACLRAAIAIRHLDEEKFRYSPEWRRRALDYLQLAKRHQESMNSLNDSPV